jgi:hypothetical protein
LTCRAYWLVVTAAAASVVVGELAAEWKLADSSVAVEPPPLEAVLVFRPANKRAIYICFLKTLMFVLKKIFLDVYLIK